MQAPAPASAPASLPTPEDDLDEAALAHWWERVGVRPSPGSSVHRLYLAATPDPGPEPTAGVPALPPLISH